MINKKVLLVSLTLALVVSMSYSAFSLSSSTFTLRSSGDESNVNSIDIYGALSDARVKFSGFHSESKDYGKGSLSLSGKAPNGDRIVLNLRLTETEIVEITGDKISIRYSGVGRYYTSGLKPISVSFDDILYEYNDADGTADLTADGTIPFSLENLYSKPYIDNRYFRSDWFR